MITNHQFCTFYLRRLNLTALNSKMINKAFILAFICSSLLMVSGFPGGSEDKESTCNTGDLGLIPGLGRPPGEGDGNPLLYSCLENPMDGGSWKAAVHGVTQSRTRLSDFTFTFHFGCKDNQSDFSIDHLVMSMYRVFSCVIGRWCLL